MAKASKNSNQVDHIVVIRSQGALLDLETMVHNAFVESCSWLVKLLQTGKAKLPATIRISESNGEWLTEAVIKDLPQNLKCVITIQRRSTFRCSL